jgi:CRISPR-associated protein Csy3
MSNSALPTFFSASRTIQYSDGIMRAVMENGSLTPIAVREFSVRGAKSSHGDAYKLARGNAKVVKDVNTPNPQSVDGAFLPYDAKKLRISFSMNVLSVSTERQSCNDFSFIGKVSQFLEAFREANGFVKIAELIIWRIASASVLWRNRYGTDKSVTVRSDGQEWQFDAEKISTRSPVDFKAPTDLVGLVAGAMSGTRDVLMLSIDTEVSVGLGQEVFPSQELEMKRDNNGKSKVLYCVPVNGVNTAALHPQKIGAAIRAFDIWHPEYAIAGPLSIEPLGYSHQHQKSFRTVNTGMDLYSYLARIEELTKDILDKKIVDERSIYLAACLMRGGVISASPNEDEKVAKAAEKKAAKAKATKPIPEAEASGQFVLG